MSDHKLEYLKKHVQDMVAQNMLKELEDVADCHVSPVHIVIERRFVASKNTIVEKLRFTADMRSVFSQTSMLCPSFTKSSWTKRLLRRILVYFASGRYTTFSGWQWAVGAAHPSPNR